MTPLAHRIAKELTLPIARRSFQSNESEFVSYDLPQKIAEAHCFEVTAVRGACAELALKMYEIIDSKRLGKLVETLYAFLPAPVTFLEWKSRTLDGSPIKQRQGILLVETNDRQWATATIVVGEDDYLGAFADFVIPLRNNEEIGGLKEPMIRKPFGNANTERAMFAMRDTYPLLAMINTPKVIGRKQHMPHAGLQRRLAATCGLVGKFPLHAWTEILLEVGPPRIDDDGPHEARLTGARALHFCRSHLRIRLGHLELVSAHWRGDPALGLKQSRYRVVPPSCVPSA